MVIKIMKELNIKDYYSEALKLTESAKISDVIIGFLQQRIDVACIVDKNDFPIGIVSKYSVYRSILEGNKIHSSVKSILQRNVLTVSDQETFKYVKDVLLEHNVAHGIVINKENKVIGVISKADIIQGFLHETGILVNQLSGLIENLQEIVISIDVNKKIVAFNSAAEEVIQLKKEAIIGKNIEECFPEISPYLVESFEEVKSIKQQKVSIGPVIGIGSFIPITYKEHTSGAIAIIKDITTLEEFAQELETTKNLQQTLQQAIALSYDAILIIKKEGRITLTNQAFLDFFEKEERNITNQYITDVLPALTRFATNPDVKKEIFTINNKTGILTKEYIVHSGKEVGMIIKIISNQLDQWKEMFYRMDKLENELNFYRSEYEKLTKNSSFDIIKSNNKIMANLKHQAFLSAKNNSTVLITGESGTGKELFAEAIHKESGRKGNFVKVNCAAIPSELLESEFFGYVDGAFTGARRGGKLGKFELADKGTLFLDEIGDMPLALQSKLLRVLQERNFERIGDHRTRTVDVRIIAATNKDLLQMVQDGEFREDFYYRINVVTIPIPPLRERAEDVPLLCNYLINKLNMKLNKQVIGISPDAFIILKKYFWPGNIRQLENILERAMNFDVKSWIDTIHLPVELTINNHKHDELTNKTSFTIPQESPFNTNEHGSLKESEKTLIIETLKSVQGNRSKAAEQLGISRTTLYNKLKKLNIDMNLLFHS
ncbi:sigma 54-interacting transcriptional regulator [Neobacillus sp. NPDC097160]|uniref:sigma 54-interacting transcriptional regulator n=1 Tax=Neobacillus sp. NPDC097160 TaxID=3364298 RepID=UPI0037F1D32B